MPNALSLYLAEVLLGTALLVTIAAITAVSIVVGTDALGPTRLPDIAFGLVTGLAGVAGTRQLAK